MRLLVYNYLSDKLALEQAPPLQYDASRSQRMDDSFAKYYRRQPRARSSHVRAHQLRGPRLAEHRLRILEGSFSTSAALRLAKEYGATIGVLFTAVLLCSSTRSWPCGTAGGRGDHGAVNLRKYFPSASARNFFNTIMVPYLFQGPQAPLRTVVASVSESFRRQLEAEQVERRMNAFGAHRAQRLCPGNAPDAEGRVHPPGRPLRQRGVHGGLFQRRKGGDAGLLRALHPPVQRLRQHQPPTALPLFLRG